jgi:cell division protein ZipA
MADELRLVLTIIGVLAIGGILGHGLWSVRKNRSELQDYKKPPRSEPGLGSSIAEDKGLDDHGVGKPRTIPGTGETGKVKKEPTINDSSLIEEPVASQPVGSDGLGGSAEPVATTSTGPATTEQAVIEPSEVLILHVSMADNQTIAGASLLPMLISLGFKYGEMDIFHRHQDNSGNGPVLFSLANMYNPGTFDIDNMEQMSTRGLSLFMTLPCHGDALKNFNMMYNGAKKIAEEFGAQILDSHRSVMTVQTSRHYVEKVREFERKQLING